MTSTSAINRVIADTNVVVSGLISKRGSPHRFILAIEQRRFTLLGSASILAEYRQVLARPFLRTKYGLAPDELSDFLKLLETRAELVEPLPVVPVDVRDPKDEMVLAAADQDLLVLADDPRLGRLRIVTVAAFLAILDAMDTNGEAAAPTSR